MTEPNPQLITDLARLVAKYSPSDWDGLLGFLRDPKRQADLVEVVEQLATVSRRQRLAGIGAGLSGEVRKALRRIRTQDPAQADLLEDVWARLRRRDLLPDMRAVRAFSDAVGLKGLDATRRDQAVTEVMKHIVDLSIGDLVTAMERAATADRSLGEEYERWVHLILARPSGLRGSPDGGEAEGQPSMPGDKDGPKVNAWRQSAAASSTRKGKHCATADGD